jgi:hypothetical protein
MEQFKFNQNQLFSDAASPSKASLGECRVARFIDGVKTIVKDRKATKPHSINILELCGVYEACRYAARNGISSEAVIYCDSLTAVSWVNKGKSNIKKQSELKEYELYIQKTGEIKETIFGDYYEIDAYRKTKGWGIRKKEGGRIEKISNPDFEAETTLAEQMLKVILDSRVRILLWDTTTYGDIPADYGRK